MVFDLICKDNSNKLCDVMNASIPEESKMVIYLLLWNRENTLNDQSQQESLQRVFTGSAR